ncbi:13602_t:CDS:2 [Gigaspora margarita]|uniref:13602_t:CDS:1 n=1 Tax=Gigaspora margarita TaxID=4874 RepID=A0ABN7V2L8_GIGMA|nr:13602_t:CDS:2 [Gigaspora margarita]
MPKSKVFDYPSLLQVFLFEIGEYQYNSSNNAYNAILNITGDKFTAESANKIKDDAYIKLVLKLGDLDIIIDLCNHNERRHKIYKAFWNMATEFLAGKATGFVTANSVKHVMLVLNIEQQSIRLLHSKMDKNYEKLISKVNSLKEICDVTESNPTFKDKLIESLQKPINLVCEVLERQFLKYELFETFSAAIDNKIKKF